MTDEERKKLCEDLRHPWLNTNPMFFEWCGKAAEEIERLAAEVKRLTEERDAGRNAGLIEAAECLEADNAKWGASWSPCVMSISKWLRAALPTGAQNE